MSLSPGDIDFAVELFSGLGEISTRRMMGGLCLYHDGTIFAIMRSDGALLLKGAGDFTTELEDVGCTQWVYTRDNGKSGAMPYWSMPDAALDDPDLACDWARRALAQL